MKNKTKRLLYLRVGARVCVCLCVCKRESEGLFICIHIELSAIYLLHSFPYFFTLRKSVRSVKKYSLYVFLLNQSTSTFATGCQANCSFFGYKIVMINGNL